MPLRRGCALCVFSLLHTFHIGKERLRRSRLALRLLNALDFSPEDQFRLWSRHTPSCAKKGKMGSVGGEKGKKLCVPSV